MTFTLLDEKGGAIFMLYGRPLGDNVRWRIVSAIFIAYAYISMGIMGFYL